MPSELTRLAAVPEPLGLDLATGEPSEVFSRLLCLLSDALRQAEEFRQLARDARDTDQELSEFFERSAIARAEQATQAEQLLIARAISKGGRVVTSAAFAAGDGATDADVAPSSERRSVRVWPAQ